MESRAAESCCCTTSRPSAANACVVPALRPNRTAPFDYRSRQGCSSQSRVSTRAKRLSKEEAAAGEWAALLKASEGSNLPSTVTSEDLNKIANKGLKLMLDENADGILDFQDELNGIGSRFSKNGETEAALFIYVLWKMCDHVIVDQTVSLKGMYLEAFGRVFNILEDSGWVLVRENEEVDDVSLDDIPNIPYMQQL